LASAADKPFFIAGDVVVDLQTGDATNGTMSVKTSFLEVRRIRTTPVQVPMTYALGTSRARMTSAPLLKKRSGRSLGKIAQGLGGLPLQRGMPVEVLLPLQAITADEPNGHMRRRTPS
jgi:hypothetical protein